MFASSIQANYLREEMNADFYSPKYLRIEAQIKNSGLSCIVLGDVLKRVFKGAFSLLASEYQSAGVPFIRVTQINSGYVSLENSTFISEETHLREHKTRVRPFDILFAKGGAYRHVAVVPQHIPDANISQDLIGATVLKGFDPHFGVAFLGSNFGKPQLIRLQQGNAQPHLTNESVRKILIAIPQEPAQNYIGDKVRQAERLRAYANGLEAGFKKSILEEFPAIDQFAVGNARHNRAKPQELDGNLNPGSFNPDRVRVRSYLKSSGGRKVAFNATIETPTTSTYSFNDRYIGLDAVGSATGTINPSTIGQEDVVGTVRLLSEGPAISKLRPYLNKVAYIPAELAGSCGSTELLCVRGESPEINWYLCGALSLQSTVRQLVPVATGSTHPRVTREDVLDVYIPWIKTPELAGKKLALAQRAFFMSDRLVSLGKLLVEALIERRVTEDELIHAQMRLEQGDNAADRAILSRLFEGGWDAKETRPLFPDLDAYYETLRMVEREQTEVAAK